MKKALISIVMLALFNYGCYSFYEISSKDISNIESRNDIKFELKNKVEILLKKEGNFNFEVGDSMIYFSNEIIEDSIKISEINKLYNKKQSFLKTFVLGLGILAGILFVTMLLSYTAIGAEGSHNPIAS